MAITPINNRYPGFIFDGENSRDYGVYITDVEVFGAPKRKVQMISIPGRNGDYALDEGSFENITVKYECALGAGTESDFNGGISDFRNWLASKVGYKTLSDEINTGEFRKAVFLDGMEVPTLNKKTGTFGVVFDCKPQRFLDSGETPVTLTSGDTITNPTLFDASPLLMVDGYGTIKLNDDEIVISDVPLGTVQFYNSVPMTVPFNKTVITSQGLTVSESFQLTNASDTLNAGDSIKIGKPWYYLNLSSMKNGKDFYFSSASVTGQSGSLQGTVTIGYRPSTLVQPNELQYKLSDITGINIVYGTAVTYNLIIAYSFEAEELNTGVVPVFTGSTVLRIAYDGADTITMSVELHPDANQFYGGVFDFGFMGISGNSTKGSLGHPLYFDLDIGEAYKYEGDAVVSVNHAVSFPAELPVLDPGANTITFDNTVTQLEIAPRWWKV